MNAIINAKALSTGISLIIYAVFLSGIFLLWERTFGSALKAFSMRKRLRRNKKSKIQQSKAVVYINNLMYSAFQKEVNGALFLGITVVLFTASFLACLKLFKFVTSFIAALMAAAVPLLVLVLKMEGDRTRGSREGISFVSELHRQYRICGRNVYTALEAAVSNPGDYPICRKHAYRLLMRVRSTGNPEEIKAETDNFAFSLGTVWGNMLAVSIRLALINGTDISEGLTDIIAQLKKANERAEERKRMNSESARMTIFLIPLLYLGTVVLSVVYLDVPLPQLLRNQFMTAEGLLFFLFSFFLFLVNLAILKLLSNTRIDY